MIVLILTGALAAATAAFIVLAVLWVRQGEQIYRLKVKNTAQDRLLAEMRSRHQGAKTVANKTWTDREVVLARLQVIMKIARGEMDPEIHEIIPDFDPTEGI